MAFRSIGAGGRAEDGGEDSRGGGAGSGKLSFYEAAPDEEISLEDFEEYALDRLRVLKGIEEERSRGKKMEEMDPLVSDLWRKHMGSDSSKKDVISHFILRLAYCRTEDLRRWFLGIESVLFRHRFRCEMPAAQQKLMDDCNLPYKAMTSAEIEAVKENLESVARSTNQVSNSKMYYKVPFEDVPELVSGRKVYLRRGEAFVPREQLSFLVVGQFRSRLSKALVLTNRKWISFIAGEEKDRLAPMVEALSTRYLGPDYTQPKSSNEISLQDLDQLAKASFPLCMRSLFFQLRDDHHLRHGGRQQLGLFLKLEDALAFWRAEFSRKVGVEKFDKEYAYNVRHNYGKEGKRTDYTPYSCVKLIMSTPGVGDHHGCPYRHFSEDKLRASLGGLGLNSRQVSSALEKTRSQHYQLACAEVFEAVHGCSSDGINHPNQYFEQSRALLQQPKVKQMCSFSFNDTVEFFSQEEPASGGENNNNDANEEKTTLMIS
ncbi:hypothetical protein SELMODRAFT_88080 [Selaginella moellendorffii]|uniref:DNA primase large subunit n=1 Tax=Selaginella moellendorffii TaxID=88036 RepID=D8R985_SELML|nr:hypothetical protein SELMODRAFT_88080 [Selaginella moellendorffii]